jgi:tellurite methyltransferase
VRIAGAVPPGTALDLACGAGRHAMWLAEQGWQVTAVDRSEAAIAELRRASGARGIPIDVHVADLERHEFEIGTAAWDLILISRYLQRDLFEPAKRGVKPGGVLIAMVLLEDPAQPQARFRARAGELRSYFPGWEILHWHELRAGSHPVAEIAARAPV